jgi:threonine aldolase
VLDHHVDRLAEDHANARRLAAGHAASRRVRVDPASVETNIVMAHVVGEDDRADRICEELRAVGVLAAPLDPRLVRFVTSLEIDRAGVDAVLAAAAPVLGFEA